MFCGMLQLSCEEDTALEMLLSILEEVRVALTAPAAVSADPRFARAGRNRPRAEWLCSTCCLSGYRSPEKC